MSDATMDFTPAGVAEATLPPLLPLAVRGLSLSFAGATVLDGLDLDLRPGGCTVILGPNGMAYSCSNLGSGLGHEGEAGALRAFRLSDGKMLWEQILPQPCM